MEAAETASGDSSMEREFSGPLGGPTMSTPNSQHASPSRPLSANSIKVELYSDEEQSGGTEDVKGEWAEEGGTEQGGEPGGGYRELTSPEVLSAGATRLPNGKLKCDICGMICIGPNVLMVHKRSHTGERPFQCNQCGASFTQKGNLLRHIKLHSGEKPFKCPFCSYACRRRDALTGHLRTHSVSSPMVGKPYKCSYCGRSYKQQSTLEEHRERCHSYLQSLETLQPGSHNPGEDMRELEFMPESLLQPSSNKMAFIDRLANAKRKRSTPQKFVGQKHMRLSLADAPYEISAGFDKDVEMHHGDLEQPQFTALRGEYLGTAGNGGSGVSDTLRPLRLPSTHASCLSEIRPVISSMAPLGPRLDCTGAGARLGAIGVVGREAAEGHEDLPTGRSHAPSPSNGCQDSTDTESMPDEPYNNTAPALPLQNNSHHHNLHLPHSNNHNPPPPPLLQHRSRERHSPSPAKDRDVEREEGGHPAALPATQAPTPSSPTAPSSTSREAYRVVDGEGRAVRSFRCEHCRVLFLDHVMFTIHMGCHGFRQPFECNICGYRSQDRYEFSSHIVRGEHILD